MKKKISLLIPIYNEEELVLPGIESLSKGLSKYQDIDYEIVLVENGSSDGTLAKLNEAKLLFENIKIYHIDHPDYGQALTYGLNKVGAENVFVFQIDCHPFDFFEECLSTPQYDLILGSRNPNKAVDMRPPLRKFLTWGLNLILRAIFKSPFEDTHGVKYIKRGSLLPLVNRCKLDGGIMETELVLRSFYANKLIREVPIPIKTYAPPKKSYLYKISRNVYLIFKLYFLFKSERIKMKPAKIDTQND